MSERMTFAEAVRDVRTRRGITQAALAEKAGLSRTQLVRIEHGLTPGPGTYQRLVGALGFGIGGELFAAAGDAESIKRVAGFAALRKASRVREPAQRIETTRWKVI